MLNIQIYISFYSISFKIQKKKYPKSFPKEHIYSEVTSEKRLLFPKISELIPKYFCMIFQKLLIISEKN